jgi:hypothetical protein
MSEQIHKKYLAYPTAVKEKALQTMRETLDIKNIRIDWNPILGTSQMASIYSCLTVDTELP